MLKVGKVMAVFVAVVIAVPLSAQFDQNLFQGLEWRLIGPFRGSRVEAVAGIPGQPDLYYFGSVAGGVWKTTNGGLQWTPMFNHESVSSIGSIAVSPSDTNIIYVGTGEACPRNDISFGDGVYKSIDGGKTWRNLGLRDTRHIGTVIINPRNPNIGFVAALGHVYGPNAERGIFRTEDGGKTWQKVLYKDDQSGGVDVVFDPHNPDILFAALWQVRRTPYSLVDGGPGSGLYKSIDGGTTWKQLEGHGLPSGILGRIGVSVSGADSNRIYAMIESKGENDLYRSDDGGETWKEVNHDAYWIRPWYFNHIFADPKNVDTVYVLDLGVYRSTDGGKNFTVLPVPPPGDNHALWIDPDAPNRMILGNDGGAIITIDGGNTWTEQNNQPTAQFYHVATDNRFNYYVYGAQQDLTTVAIASSTDTGSITDRDWYVVGGGESGFVIPDPRDSDVVYAGDHFGLVSRFDKRTGQVQTISPVAIVSYNHPAARLPHRFQWTAPMFISPTDPNALYLGGESLWKTIDQGMSWTSISPDLTRNDKSKQQSSGGPLYADNTSAEFYDEIFALAESPLQKGLLWVGTDDGLVHLSRDDGKTWSNVTPKDIPSWSRVDSIDPSPLDAGTAYVAVDNHQQDDFRPYVFETTDYGKTWTRITTGLPDDGYVHVVRADIQRRGLLFAGLETGVWVSFNDGRNWQSLQQNLPTAPVYDLVLKGADLVIATHGRAFWILDDISPLRQLTQQVAGSDHYLYHPKPAYRVHSSGAALSTGGLNIAQSAPSGAIIDYYLKSAPTDDIHLQILDGRGRVVRQFTSKVVQEAGFANPYFPGLRGQEKGLPARAGANRFVWDLRYANPVNVPGVFLTFEAPLVLPGSYEVQVMADGKTFTAPLEVKLDPRVHVSMSALQAQQDLALRVRERVSEDHSAVNQIRALREQLQTLRKRLETNFLYQKDVKQIDDIAGRITSLENQLIQVKSSTVAGSLMFPDRLDGMLASIGTAVESADTAPTAQVLQGFKTLSEQLDQVLAVWKDIRTKSVSELNEALLKQNIPIVAVDPVTEK